MAVPCPRCAASNADTSRFCAECGSSLQAALQTESGQTEFLPASEAELRTGALFASRYQIIEELGKGGMGRVYRAFDRKLDEEVALKLVRADVASDAETLERFRNELKLARRISHKNVGRMYELLEEGGTHFITMEYIPGQDLKGLIRQTGRLGTSKTVSIARQITEGLAEAHRLGVVHRDLKPSNIMIDREGNGRIMDFGIARSLRGRGVTAAGMMVGTPEYMSPEQVGGMETDGRSDFYSLGILLFEMSTGRLPFEGETPLGLAHKQVHEPPPDPRTIEPGVPEALSALILRLLDKDPASRPQNAEDILSALAEIELSLTPGSRPVLRSSAKRKGDARGGHPPWILPVAAGAAVLAGVGVLLLLPLLRKPETSSVADATSQWKSSIAVLPFLDSSPRKDQGHLCTGMAEAVSVRLSRVNPEIKVTSPQSAYFYQDKGLSIQEISRRLDVKNILHGTVQREGERLRITAQLINAADEALLWSDIYDQQEARVLDIQDDISLKIAEALRAQLIPDADAVMKTLRPGNPEAYEYYLKGMHFLKSRYIITFEEADFQEAVRMFDKAVEIDPGYAGVYVGLCWTYEHHFYVTDDLEDTKKAQEFGAKAFEIDPDGAETNALTAYIAYSYQNDFDRAFRLSKKALATDPNNASVNFLTGIIYQYFGLYDEGIAYLTKAMALDPNYFWNPYKLGMCYLDLGDFEKSARYFDKYFEVAPKAMVFPGRYIWLLIKMKAYDKARERIAFEEKLSPGAAWLARYRALLLAAEGRKSEALALHKDSEVYSLLGMKDEAVTCLRADIRPSVYPAYKAHPYLYYIFMAHNPHFDNIRNDPRFLEILASEKKLFDSYKKKYGTV